MGPFFGIKAGGDGKQVYTRLKTAWSFFIFFQHTLIISRIVSGMIRIKSADSETVIPSSSIISTL
ncbi:MAG: hypothetical protein IPL50_21070 [Chitinophagaceae bacterium]|nr:hypothetical protein [Chitinophagaceae bacterium]